MQLEDREIEKMADMITPVPNWFWIQWNNDR